MYNISVGFGGTATGGVATPDQAAAIPIAPATGPATGPLTAVATGVLTKKRGAFRVGGTMTYQVREMTPTEQAKAAGYAQVVAKPLAPATGAYMETTIAPTDLVSPTQLIGTQPPATVSWFKKNWKWLAIGAGVLVVGGVVLKIAL
jgi:hypothetical protein